jgi:predicted ribosome quality control (RQC) complex YloA/Tae2 family protein
MNKEFTDKDFSSLQKLANVATEDVKSLQQEIRDNPRTIIDEDPPTVEPATQSNDIGRLSAEAVQSQYEAAAKAVEDMGLAVQDRIKKLENALRECDRDMKLLGEVAHTIRDKGNLVYAQIEETSSVSKDLRTTAEAFRTNVTQP